MAVTSCGLGSHSVRYGIAGIFQESSIQQFDLFAFHFVGDWTKYISFIISRTTPTRRFSWLNENQIVPMNGFADHGLDEAAFGEKKGFSEGLRTFDAFRKLDTSPSRSS